MKLSKISSALCWHPWAVTHKLRPGAGHSTTSYEGQRYFRGLQPLCFPLFVAGFGKGRAFWWSTCSWRCCLSSRPVLCPQRSDGNWIWIPVAAQLKLSRQETEHCKIVFCLCSTLEIIFHENTAVCNGLSKLSVCAVGNCVPKSG